MYDFGPAGLYDAEQLRLARRQILELRKTATEMSNGGISTADSIKDSLEVAAHALAMEEDRVLRNKDIVTAGLFVFMLGGLLGAVMFAG